MAFASPFSRTFSPPFGGAPASAAFSPIDIPGLIFWGDFSDASTMFSDTTGTTPITADGKIAKLLDKSGSGNHMTQGTLNNRPQYKTAIKNGLSIGRFDTTDALIMSSNVSLSTSYTLYGIAYRNTTSSLIFFSSITGSSYWRWNGPGALIALPPNTEVNIGGTWGITTWYTIRIQQNGTSSSVWKNNAATTVYNNGSTLDFGSIGLQGSFSLDADVAEVMVWNNPISTADAALLENYALAKWAVY